jgi:ketosteroid isomerase-like protein
MRLHLLALHLKQTFLRGVFYAVAIVVVMSAASTAAEPDGGARKSLDEFNQAFVNACQTMNQKSSAALWAEDGVDLLPGMQPMVRQAKIAAWLDSVASQVAGAKMAYCTVDWKDIQIHGDLAYEWGINRQKIEFPGQQKSFANEGKIVLVLKRQASGSWKIALESWNSSPEADTKQ